MNADEKQQYELTNGDIRDKFMKFARTRANALRFRDLLPLPIADINQSMDELFPELVEAKHVNTN